MYISKGSHRTVFVFPDLGFVVKVPRIRWRQGLFGMFYWLRKGSFFWYLQNSSVYQYGTAKIFLMRGIVDNWKEYRFYRNTKFDFLQPTYFSFFGLCNIQRYAPVCTFDIFEHLLVLTDEAVLVDMHHFSNASNFSLKDDVFTILDYASPGVQQVLVQYGEKIAHELPLCFEKKPS